MELLKACVHIYSHKKGELQYFSPVQGMHHRKCMEDQNMSHIAGYFHGYDKTSSVVHYCVTGLLLWAI